MRPETVVPTEASSVAIKAVRLSSPVQTSADDYRCADAEIPHTPRVAAKRLAEFHARVEHGEDKRGPGHLRHVRRSMLDWARGDGA